MIAATAFFLTTGIAAPAMAVDCQIASKAKPALSFTSASHAPKTWKQGRVPSKLMRQLQLIAADNGKPAKTADHPLDGVEYMCDDWIAICANDDCTHGVVECDGVCAPF